MLTRVACILKYLYSIWSYNQVLTRCYKALLKCHNGHGLTVAKRVATILDFSPSGNQGHFCDVLDDNGPVVDRRVPLDVHNGRGSNRNFRGLGLIRGPGAADNLQRFWPRPEANPVVSPDLESNKRIPIGLLASLEGSTCFWCYTCTCLFWVLLNLASV